MEKNQVNNFELATIIVDRSAIFLVFGFDDPTNPGSWIEFQKDLNNQYKRQWNTEELGTKVNFLDLTISINKQVKLSFQTFQKLMNPFFIHFGTLYMLRIW